MVSFRFRPYFSKKSVSGSHSVRSQVGLNDGLDAFLKRVTTYLGGNQSHDFSIVQPVTQSLYKLYQCFPARVPLDIVREFVRNEEFWNKSIQNDN
jgi:hypothetical protein